MGEQLFELRRTKFDTPHFAGIEFIEVEAKSILNRVPGNYLPFDWTINPYRGCSHACVYCLSGDTAILMGDGRTKPLEDVRVGDDVYGTVRSGSYRRYVLTKVLAHWSTVKPAYRVSLEDGTELVASGDHRFLTDRGWKHVTGSERGRLRRPHLTVNDKLIGTGRFARARFLSAPVDFEAVRRGRDFLMELGIRTREFSFAEAVGGSKKISAIRSSPRDQVQPIAGIIDQPTRLLRKWVKGTAIKSDARLAVASVEPLGLSLPMFDITTGTGDFIANGVVSHNCFARATHTYLDMNAGRDFETKIVVKVNAPQLLKKELRSRRWKGDPIAMGTATDPYQRAEGRYKLMRGIVETLVEFRNPFSILTKGTLILRDLDLLSEAAGLTEVSTALSVGTLDEDAWRKSEPGTPHPKKRIEAVRRLNEAGIPCGVMVAPVLPGITDDLDKLKAVVEAAVAAGATHVSPILLHLRPKVKEVYMEWLATTYPELVDSYEAMYGRGAYASSAAKATLSDTVKGIVSSSPPAPVVVRINPGRRVPPKNESPAEPVHQLSLI
ncbi:MAG: radical SAM protein [Actinomycetota bacterium]|nr:radical SAM protein [Actinomycetota bacterium]